MNKPLVIGLLTVITALGLAGCQQTKAPATQSASRSQAQTPKAPAAYLTAVKARGLTVDGQKPLNTLPDGAQSGVTWQAESHTTMQLIRFDTSAQANAARSTAVQNHQRAYTQGGLLLTADMGLGKGWFEKYQQAIFRQ